MLVECRAHYALVPTPEQPGHWVHLGPAHDASEAEQSDTDDEEYTPRAEHRKPAKSVKRARPRK